MSALTALLVDDGPLAAGRRDMGFFGRHMQTDRGHGNGDLCLLEDFLEVFGPQSDRAGAETGLQSLGGDFIEHIGVALGGVGVPVIIAEIVIVEEDVVAEPESGGGDTGGVGGINHVMNDSVVAIASFLAVVGGGPEDHDGVGRNQHLVAVRLEAVGEIECVAVGGGGIYGEAAVEFAAAAGAEVDAERLLLGEVITAHGFAQICAQGGDEVLDIGLDVGVVGGIDLAQSLGPPFGHVVDEPGILGRGTGVLALLEEFFGSLKHAVADIGILDSIHISSNLYVGRGGESTNDVGDR